MKIFVTGGTGLIGSAVVQELLENGHEVLALARSESSADKLKQAGAEVLRGTLDDLDVLRVGAGQTDGSIHLAFSNDFSSPETIAHAITQEAAALDTLGKALIGSDKPLVTVSGTPVMPGTISTEDDENPMDGPTGGRNRSVQAVLELAGRGVRSSAVRLPRTVHNNGEGGFAGVLTQTARQSGVVGYPGDGSQRWPAVHAKDAAALFRLALENAPAGRAWHAVADEGDSVKDIAEVIGRQLGLPVEQVAAETFGPLGQIFMVDQPASSAHTRQQLGWNPRHPGLLADLENLRP